MNPGIYCRGFVFIGETLIIIMVIKILIIRKILSESKKILFPVILERSQGPSSPFYTGDQYGANLLNEEDSSLSLRMTALF
jgi:hypothetical protein